MTNFLYYHQGFGFLYMPNAILPNKLSPNMKLEFVDNWKDREKQLSRTGQSFSYKFSLSGGKVLESMYGLYGCGRTWITK